MSSLVCKLEEQLTDLRSDQIAYKFTIENGEQNPIRLLAVTPKIPKGVQLVEISDTSLAEASARKVELLRELNTLLSQLLWAVSADFRKNLIDRQKEALKEIVSVTGIMSFYFQLLSSPRQFEARLKAKSDSLAFKVSSSADAWAAYQRWIETSANDYEAIRMLFHAKTEQLMRIEERMEEGDRTGLTSIEAGSLFSSTYVLKFRRRSLEPVKYQVSFYASYMRDSKPHDMSCATNVQISPRPWCLSVVAVLASILGIVLKLSLSGIDNIVFELMRLIYSGKIVIAPIVALIFYNIYEYTSIGKNMNIAVSWRSALLIGALCGVAQERILKSLTSLIGS